MDTYTYISATKRGARPPNLAWSSGDMGQAGGLSVEIRLRESWWEHGGQSQGMNYQLGSVVIAQASS